MHLLYTLGPVRLYQLANGALALDRDDGAEVTDEEVEAVIGMLQQEGGERRKRSPALTIQPDEVNRVQRP
jgi:hypothetical protein